MLDLNVKSLLKIESNANGFSDCIAKGHFLLTFRISLASLLRSFWESLINEYFEMSTVGVELSSEISKSEKLFAASFCLSLHERSPIKVINDMNFVFLIALF